MVFPDDCVDLYCIWKKPAPFFPGGFPGHCEVGLSWTTGILLVPETTCDTASELPAWHN